jgi:uncharacterized membrane protein YdjX (TVP38/TMEM64 family)
MTAPPPSAAQRFSSPRRLIPLIVVILLAGAAYAWLGNGGISLEALVRHRMRIDVFVQEHRALAVLAYISLYIAVVGLSLPGSAFLTVTGGFLFGLPLGATAAVIADTIGATIIFLVARSALGEPLLRRAGPRAAQMAQGFRDDAFNYLLFLRLVPIFPFFLVNLVPAFAGVRLMPFIAATTVGVIPGALVFAFAGTGLDSIITAERAAYEVCLASRQPDCRMTFEAKDALTPELIGVLIALGALALMPVILKRWRGRSRAPL